MAKPEFLEIESLTDESGRSWLVSFWVGRMKVYSREMPRRASAEKLARIMREAFPSSLVPLDVSVPDHQTLSKKTP